MIRSAIFHRLWQAPPFATGEEAARRWLSPAESETLAELPDATRRRCWLAGRILLKRILLEELLPGMGCQESTEAAEIEIISRDGLGRAVRPRVFIGGRQQPWNLSLAHCDRSVFAAICNADDVSVGVDLVPREIGRRGFADFWLTPREQREWSQSGNRESLAMIWAAKEAAYKAIGQGEPFQPNRIEVFPTEHSLTCCWNGSPQLGQPRIEVFDAGPHIAVLVAINNVLSEAIA